MKKTGKTKVAARMKISTSKALALDTLGLKNTQQNIKDFHALRNDTQLEKKLIGKNKLALANLLARVACARKDKIPRKIHNKHNEMMRRRLAWRRLKPVKMKQNHWKHNRNHDRNCHIYQ